MSLEGTGPTLLVLLAAFTGGILGFVGVVIGLDAYDRWKAKRGSS